MEDFWGTPSQITHPKMRRLIHYLWNHIVPIIGIRHYTSLKWIFYSIGPEKKLFIGKHRKPYESLGLGKEDFQPDTNIENLCIRVVIDEKLKYYVIPSGEPWNGPLPTGYNIDFIRLVDEPRYRAKFLEFCLEFFTPSIIDIETPWLYGNLENYIFSLVNQFNHPPQKKEEESILSMFSYKKDLCLLDYYTFTEGFLACKNWTNFPMILRSRELIELIQILRGQRTRRGGAGDDYRSDIDEDVEELIYDDSDPRFFSMF
jgi:hypothetical protein